MCGGLFSNVRFPGEVEKLGMSLLVLKRAFSENDVVILQSKSILGDLFHQEVPKPPNFLRYEERAQNKAFVSPFIWQHLSFLVLCNDGEASSSVF